MDRQPISQEGYNKLREQLKHLEDVEMPDVTRRVAEARAEGDLSENAEYHGARESQGQLQAKINQLKTQLSNCYIAEKSTAKGIIGFGSTVTVEDVDDGMEEKYELVGPGETNYDGEVMKILSNSPLGSCLVGKKVGDVVEVPLPRGSQTLKVTVVVDPT